MTVEKRTSVDMTRTMVMAAALAAPFLAATPWLDAQATNPPHHVEFRFGSVSAAPGREVTVPFFIRLDAPGQGYSFSADFDEEVLELTAIDSIFRNPDGTPTSFEQHEFNHDDQ